MPRYFYELELPYAQLESAKRVGLEEVLFPIRLFALAEKYEVVGLKKPAADYFENIAPLWWSRRKYNKNQKDHEDYLKLLKEHYGGCTQMNTAMGQNLIKVIVDWDNEFHVGIKCKDMLEKSCELSADLLHEYRRREWLSSIHLKNRWRA
jgi:hypothetical protein